MTHESIQAVPDIAVDNGVPKTTSLEVARVFDKRHDNVIRDIRQLLQDVTPGFGLLNFEECFRINVLANGKKEPYFKLTKDGFTMLAMGYTGKQAIQFKEAYIRRFNELEAALNRRVESVQEQDWHRRKFAVTWDEWLVATHHMKDHGEEHKRIKLVLQIEREALDRKREVIAGFGSKLI